MAKARRTYLVFVVPKKGTRTQYGEPDRQKRRAIRDARRLARGSSPDHSDAPREVLVYLDNGDKRKPVLIYQAKWDRKYETLQVEEL